MIWCSWGGDIYFNDLCFNICWRQWYIVTGIGDTASLIQHQPSVVYDFEYIYEEYRHCGPFTRVNFLQNIQNRCLIADLRGWYIECLLWIQSPAFALPLSKLCYISMVECKTVVTPLLMHWSYYSLALSHRYNSVLYWTMLWTTQHHIDQSHITEPLTHEWLETHGCLISTAATAALVLKHQANSNHSADKIFSVSAQFHTQNITFTAKNIKR